MNILDWRHYRLLLGIQNAGSLTGAAKIVGVTQSAATHQMKEAERRLGVNLVKRHGRSLELTPAGQTLAEAAGSYLPEMQRAEDKARELTHSAKSRLRIAFGPQDGLDWVTDAAAHLSDLQIQPDLIAAGRRSPAQCVQAGEADLAVEIGTAQFPGVRRHHIYNDELVCIMAPEHTLARAASVSAENVTTETYFAHSLVPKPGFELEAFFSQSGKRPAHIANIESLEAIIKLTASKHGVSIQPRSAVATAEQEGRITIRSLAPTPVHQSWYLHAKPELLQISDDGLLSRMVTIVKRALGKPAKK